MNRLIASAEYALTSKYFACIEKDVFLHISQRNEPSGFFHTAYSAYSHSGFSDGTRPLQVPDGQLYSSYSHTFMPRRFPASRHRPTSLSQSSPMYSHSSPLRGYSIICPNPASRESENIFSTSAASGLPVIAVNSISGEEVSALSLSAAATESMQQHAAASLTGKILPTSKSNLRSFCRS